jgi:hypothetical protein
VSSVQILDTPGARTEEKSLGKRAKEVEIMGGGTVKCTTVKLHRKVVYSVSRLTTEDRYNGPKYLGGDMTWDLADFKLEDSC